MSSLCWTPPPLPEVQALHERYLREVVMGLNVCPFAQRSADQGRVTRLWWSEPSIAHNLSDIGERFASTVHQSELEIVLLSFVLPPDDPHQDPAAFEQWHKAFRSMLSTKNLDKDWYSVCFHPNAGELATSRATAASFVQLLRRTPDPVIQCVRVSTLETVRAKAQQSAQQELIETLRAKDPALALVAQSCVMTDSQLSASIARKNHEAWAQDPGWSRLQATLESIQRDREALNQRASRAASP